MNTAPALPYVRVDEDGRPWIDDTNAEIIELVLGHLAHGWNAETIRQNHPALSCAQVHAALA